jgi:hypothetical protein
MAKYALCILVCLLLKISSFAQSYGLIFNSHEVVLEKRTALDLSPNDSICLSKNFELSFDLMFLRNYQVYFGYVFRIVSNNNENIDLIYNQPTSSFQVIAGENFSGISFNIDSLRLYKLWNTISLKCDLEKHTLQCAVNNKTIGTSSLAITGNCFKFLWGANDFRKFKTRDIPPMQIKDIRIAEKGETKYYWPLDETAGNVCYDQNDRRAANVKNPVWVKTQHQNWEKLGSFTFNGYAGVAFDPKTDKLYITGSDSLAVYTLKNERSLEWTASKHQNLLLGHQNIYDTLSNQLWDIYADEKRLVPFNFIDHKWAYSFPSGPVRVTEFWHSNKFISPADTSLYIVGGYGYLRYKNLVQRYNLATKKWDLLTPSGDYFTPRYLSALGTDPAGKFAYIIGGYGSQTGDQMLDPKYNYDLFRYDVQKNSFRKLYSFKPANTAFTFANSLIIDSSNYYGLVFSNDSYNSSLRLVKGSLKDSVLQQLAGAIPYKFHDIQSFADLYYSPISNKLIAVTLFYTPEDAKELNTEVNIYSINFPPVPLDPVVDTRNDRRSNWALWFAAGGAIMIAGVLFVRKRIARSKRAVHLQLPTVTEEASIFPTRVLSKVYPEQNQKSAIFLFGQFQVFDKEGNDITRLFTPLLKELFLIIAVYTLRNGRGISSEGLNEILWHNKSEKDAKNNRSVNIVKLKGILEKVGQCTIDKKSGYWQFETTGDDIYIDYRNYMALVHAVPETGTEGGRALLEIIRRGAFLMQTEYGWLDDIKSEISNFVIICRKTLSM